MALDCGRNRGGLGFRRLDGKGLSRRAASISDDLRNTISIPAIYYCPSSRRIHTSFRWRQRVLIDLQLAHSIIARRVVDVDRWRRHLRDVRAAPRLKVREGVVGDLNIRITRRSAEGSDPRWQAELLLVEIRHLLRTYSGADRGAVRGASTLVPWTPNGGVRNAEVSNIQNILVKTTVGGSLKGRMSTEISVERVGGHQVW